MNPIDVSYVCEGMWLGEKRTTYFAPAMSDRIRFGTKLYRVIQREFTLSENPIGGYPDHLEIYLEEIKL